MTRDAHLVLAQSHELLLLKEGVRLDLVDAHRLLGHFLQLPNQRVANCVVTMAIELRWSIRSGMHSRVLKMCLLTKTILAREKVCQDKVRIPCPILTNCFGRV